MACDTMRGMGNAADLPRFIFCNHKVGTKLSTQLATLVAPLLGWKRKGVRGLVHRVEPGADLVVFAHSLIGFDLAAMPHRGIRLVRDPRDVWLSGYLYHRHCREAWCLASPPDNPVEPILFPLVPYSQQHRPEAWKRDYLAALGGRSYQDNLLALDREAGLAFEETRYAAWTLEAMADWRPAPGTIDIRMEDIAADFDGTMARMFRHLGVPDAMIGPCVEASRAADVARMDDAQLAANPHIHGRQLSKWRSMLTAAEVARFEARHGDAIRSLGYPLSS
ncbi:hypothetical protein G3576_10840 [Roseomonas stagni]|uniref:Sulfotransferase domain-containing protein n=1 Tax=Falsiroseomonas algicola TaxID=2716930 RepID=A0A6M1LK34_9PROT|nr:hypothetical protein [Falsiroseomonas algicola]NGM20512.1 hypothetical protein [Falsiroseomonas algicola]